MRHYLYLTTNTVNQKIYIGIHSTEKPFGTDGYMGSGTLVTKAFNKYGKDAFTCEILCEAPSRSDIEELEELAVDQEFVDRNNTYNLKTGGGHGLHSEESKAKMTGRKHSEETRAKISAANTGENNPRYGKKHSEETKIKMSSAKSGENHYNYGKKASEETRAKISAANTGENNPNYGKTGENHPRYGKKHSEETKVKMSASTSGENHHYYGKNFSEEHKAKISAANTGKKREIVTCPHCGKSGGINAMKRYHFSNCKSFISELPEQH